MVEGDAPIESLMDLRFGAGRAETAGLLVDLEAAALPLHGVVVADHALVHEATGALG